jgi:hypothetical protein
MAFQGQAKKRQEAGGADVAWIVLMRSGRQKSSRGRAKFSVVRAKSRTGVEANSIFTAKISAKAFCGGRIVACFGKINCCE